MLRTVRDDVGSTVIADVGSTVIADVGSTVIAEVGSTVIARARSARGNLVTLRILETGRTVVDRITLDDAGFFVTLMNSPGWLRFIGDRGIADAADARRHLEERFLRSYDDHGFGYYVVRTAADGVSAGVCGFLKKPALDNPDFGFAFLPEHAGRGLAFEACRAVLDYGVARFGFPVLDAVTRADNERSMRLLDKCGFRRVGPVAGLTPDCPDVLFRWHAAGRSQATG